MNGSSDISTRTLLALTVILALAGILRLHRLGDRELNLDEAYSYRFAEGAELAEVASPFSEMNRQDRHPTLHYTLTWVWLRTGGLILTTLGLGREAAFRLPAVLFSLLSVWLIYRCGSILGGPSIGLIAASLLAVSGFSVDVAREMRMYSMLELGGLWTLYETLRIKRAGVEAGLRDWSRLTCAAFFVSLSHYAGLIFAACAWSYLLIADRRLWRPLIGSGLALTLIYSYWLAGLWNQLQQETAGAESGFRPSSGLVIPYTYVSYFLSEFLVPIRGRADIPAAAWALIACGAALVVTAGGLLVTRRIESRRWGGPAFLAIAPLLVMWLGSFFVRKLFMNARYALAAEGSFLLLIALGVGGLWALAAREAGSRQAWGWRTWGWNIAGTVPIAIFVGLNSLASLHLYGGEQGRPYIPWREAVVRADSWTAEAAVVYSPHMAVPLEFYGIEIPTVGLPLQGAESWEELTRMVPQLNRPAGSRILFVIAHPHRAEEDYRRLFDRHARTLETRIISSAPDGPWSSPFQRAELRLIELR